MYYSRNRSHQKRYAAAKARLAKYGFSRIVIRLCLPLSSTIGALGKPHAW